MLFNSGKMVKFNTEKVCEICERKFIGRWNQKYCGEKCRREAWRRYLNKRYEEKLRRQEQKNLERLERLKRNKSVSHPDHQPKKPPPEVLTILIEMAKQQQYPSLYRKKNKCEACGSTENLRTHHIKYYPPMRVTLCSKCHGYLHSNLLARKRVRPY